MFKFVDSDGNDSGIALTGMAMRKHKVLLNRQPLSEELPERDFENGGRTFAVQDGSTIVIECFRKPYYFATFKGDQVLYYRSRAANTAN
jgi:hypothetical protein